MRNPRKRRQRKWFRAIGERARRYDIRSGFRKSDTVERNVDRMKRKASADVRRGVSTGPPTLTAARRAQALANVSTDPETKSKASSVAKKLYSEYSESAMT